MAYEVIILGHLHMPLYFLGTFTEYPCLYTLRRCIITHFNFWPLHFLAERGEYVALFLYIVLSI